MARTDPIRSNDFLKSGHSANIKIYELECHKAAVGGLTHAVRSIGRKDYFKIGVGKARAHDKRQNQRHNPNVNQRCYVGVLSVPENILANLL